MDWSPEEAEQFYQWLMENLSRRIDHLLAFLNEEIPSCHKDWEEFLVRLGLKYASRLRTTPLSQNINGRLQLTNRGTALAADSGLLVAHLLIHVPGSHVRWEVLRDPGAFGHNHPVLRGFVQNLYLDPVGGSVYAARALVNGKKSPDLLKQAFVFWKDRMA